MPRAVYTALVVLLLRPAAAIDAQRFQQLQRIRHTYDAAYTRWLPHITLVPPFPIEATDVPDDAASGVPITLAHTLQGLSVDVAEACARHTPHMLRLNETGVFRLRRYENIHLRPDAASVAPFLALQRDVQRASAAYIPPGKRRPGRFVPHASLGQAYTSEDKADLVQVATRDLGLEHGGLTVCVDGIQVMYKPSQERGAYTLWRTLPLPRSSVH